LEMLTELIENRTMNSAISSVIMSALGQQPAFLVLVLGGGAPPASATDTSGRFLLWHLGHAGAVFVAVALVRGHEEPSFSATNAGVVAGLDGQDPLQCQRAQLHLLLGERPSSGWRSAGR